jgi:uncharacterized repeat protein (TIGR02543 family)
VVATAIVGANILDNASKPTPVYTGYTLAGWAYDAEGTETVGAGDNITNGLTVYAKWTINTYTVTYTLNSGTNNVANPATFDVTDLPITLEDATYAAHTFDGWFDNAEFTGDAVTAISTVGNKALFAKFTLS